MLRPLLVRRDYNKIYINSSFFIIIFAIFITILARAELKGLETVEVYEIKNKDAVVELDVFCNRIFDLMLVLKLEPPMQISLEDRIKGGGYFIGEIKVEFSNGDSDFKVNLGKKGGCFNRGLWLVSIDYFPSKLIRTCSKEKITVFIKDLSIDLDKHKFFLQFERDGRP